MTRKYRFLFLTLVAASFAHATEAGRNAWTSNGPEGGAVFSIAVDPSNSENVFLGTDGGVERSGDGGMSWRHCNAGIPEGRAYGVAVSDDGRTVLATVWSGLYRSDDGGTTWRGMSVPDPNSALRSVAMAPGNPQSVIVGSDLKVLKSGDGGTTWHEPQINGPNSVFEPFSIIFDRSAPGDVYMAAGDVFKSSDGGETWTGFKFGNIATSMALDLQHPSTVVWGDFGGAGIFRSADGGKHVLSSDAGIPRYLIGFCDSCTQPIIALASDASGDRMFAAVYGDGVYRSTDGGVTWVPWSRGLSSRRIYSFGSGRGSGGLFAGTLGAGVSRLPDGASEWARSNTGLRQSYVSDLAMFPDDSNRILASTDGGVFVTTDGGSRWHLSNDGLGVWDVETLRINPQNPHFILAGTWGAGVYRSLDGGNSWSVSSTDFGQHGEITAIAFDQNNPGVSYAGSSTGRIWKSSDRGMHWTMTPFSSIFSIASIVVDPANSSILSASIQAYGGYYRSTDGGQTWESPADSECPFARLLADPSEPSHLYALGGCVSLDNGATWAYSVPWPSELTAGSFDRESPPHLFVSGAGIYSDVYRSGDGGSSWRTLGPPPVPKATTSMAVSPSGRQVHMGTRGKGVFDLSVFEAHPVPGPVPVPVRRLP